MTSAPLDTRDDTLPLAPGRWRLDPDHTTVGFVIRRFGLAKVRGRFRRLDAELVVGASLDDCHVTATIDMASVDTGNDRRDGHLRSPDLLDVVARPTMRFRSTRIEGDGSAWSVHGEVSIGDVTRPLTLTGVLGEVTAFHDGTRHVGFEAEAELRRSQLGLGFGRLGATLGDDVRIELDLELVEPVA